MITSTSNPLVKELVRLRERRHRDATGTFVIEGRREVSLAVAAGVDIQRVVVSPPLGGEAPITEAPVIEMAEAPFRRASIRQNPDGVLAVARHLDTALGSHTLPPDGLVLVVEGIEKPGNLGAMLRTADAAGGLVVVADPPPTSTTSVVRASQGRSSPCRWSPPTGPPAGSKPARCAWWRPPRCRLRAVGHRPHRRRRPRRRGGGDRAQPTHARRRNPCQVPMCGRVDSLNASVTAGIVLRGGPPAPPLLTRPPERLAIEHVFE